MAPSKGRPGPSRPLGPVAAVLGLLVAGALGAVALPVTADGHVHVSGHARVVGTSPADGSTVEALPDRVTITFAAKPATVEGDPLRVYGPSGRRVDDGDVRIGRDGEVLSVGLTGAAVTGRYAVAYHVVSADSHLVAGRFAFTVTGGESAATDPAPARRAPRAGPADVRPEIAAAGVGAVGVAARMRRSRAARRSTGATRQGGMGAAATRGDSSTDAGSGRRTVP